MEANLVKLICDGLGCVDYEELLEKIDEDEEDVEKLLKNSDKFIVIEQNKSKKILITSKIRRCRTGDRMDKCSDLHLCKFELVGQCERQGCKYGHSLEEEHNSRVLREHGLQDLNRDQLRLLLLLNDHSLLPNVCVSYNKGSGDFGKCPEREACVRLHICEKYIRGVCDASECKRSHDFHEPHPAQTLHTRGISSQLIVSLLQIYRNLLILKDHRNLQFPHSGKRRGNPEAQRNRVNKICLWFIRGNCKNGDDCLRVHCELPYKWQVKVDEVWNDLPDNEVIERDYCDPAKIHSVGVGGEPVCFDTMMCGVHRVQRLSTESSVMEPRFSHTTHWRWYWENHENNWIQYQSVKETQRLSDSISSEDLEKKYLHFLEDNSCNLVIFTAGNQCSELNFRVMKQRNEFSSTETAVRRRPTFVSLADVRATNRGPNFSSRTGVPGFWDKAAIPKSGFQLVQLHSSHKDYHRVQEHFNQTMKDFSILSIKRLQNKKLWENFQTKREQIKKANSLKKYSGAERLLFHGTNSRNLNTVCQQNFDMKASEANAWMYGQGISFSRDAIRSNDYTDLRGERVMFACRVLIGQYTKGDSHYHQPPAKDAAGNLYDSCVNDVRNPSVYVVFERSQVYPEFLITYQRNRRPEDIQASILNGMSQTERSLTGSRYRTNANSSSTETSLSPASMDTPVASPPNPDLQKDDVMMRVMEESGNVFHAAPKSESSVYLRAIPGLESDQDLSTSPVSSDYDNPPIGAKPRLTDNSFQSNSTLQTSDLFTEKMSLKILKCGPIESPEFNKSMSDSRDLIPCSSDKAKIVDASLIAYLSERKSETTISCKSHQLGHGFWVTVPKSSSEDVISSANPKKELCSSHQTLGSLSSTRLAKTPAKTSLTSENVPVSSSSHHQLRILDKPGTIDREYLPSKSNPESVIRLEDLSAVRRRVASKSHHPVSSTSECFSAGKLSLGSSSAPKESELPTLFTGSSSSAARGSRSDLLASCHKRQPLPPPPPPPAVSRLAEEAQNKQKQKCLLQ